METLADRIARDGALNELDAVGWIIRLAKKLEAMHARGNAHGAISPSVIKIATISRTSLGMLVPPNVAPARAEFHSPERVLQSTKGPADDAWATAATLYSMLTGTNPFAAGDVDDTKQKILTTTPAPLATFDVGDDDLQHILDAALTRDQNRRSGTVAALRQALEGWHPDKTVRDLPPLADDQLEEDDDEARTVMRPVAAVQAMRAIRKDAPAPPKPLPEAPPMREPAKTVPNMEAVTALAAATAPGAPLPKAHGLLEDDDEEKTSLMRVPMVPMRKPAPSAQNLAPAAVAPAARPPISARGTMLGQGPAPGQPLAPPVAAQPSTGFGPMGRPAGGPAARALAAARSGAPSQRTPFAPPVAAPPPAARAPAPSRPESSGFISREAVIDDGDEEATVMREAPIELLMQSSKDESGSEADRATPVNPIPAEVAAAAGGNEIVDEATVMQHDRATPPAPNPQAAAIAAFNGAPQGAALPAPQEARPPEPTMVLPDDDEVATLYVEGKGAADIRLPEPPPQAPRADSLPDLFAQTTEQRPSAPEKPVAPLVNTPSFVPPEAAPRASGMPQQAPLAAPPQPSAAKGLLLGVIIALVLIGVTAGVYFTLFNKP